MTEQKDYAKFNEAMAKFQGEYDPPKKDKKVDYKTSKGQEIKYEYSDLESLQRAIRKTASKHGLSWNVDFEYEETEITNYGKAQKALVLITKVIINHSSGVEKTFKGVPLYISAFDPQSIGSVKTYSERYALGGAFGIASDSDDDGQIARDLQENNQNDNSKKTNSAPEDDNAQQIENAIQEYQDFLLDNGQNMGDLIKYVINKEKVTSIDQVSRVRVMGYYKAFAIRQRTKNAELEKEQNEQANQNAQQTELEELRWGPSK